MIFRSNVLVHIFKTEDAASDSECPAGGRCKGMAGRWKRRCHSIETSSADGSKKKIRYVCDGGMENMPLCPIRKTQNDSKIGNDFKNC